MAFVVDLITSWPGGLLYCLFAIAFLLLTGLAINVALRLPLSGFEAIVFAAATGTVTYAFFGLCIATSGSHRQLVAGILVIGGVAVSTAFLIYKKSFQELAAELDRYDIISLALYTAMVFFCFSVSYVPITFPTTLIDGPYIYKTHNVHVKIQALTGTMPVDNYLPHIVSEYLLRGISFTTEHPIVPGQEVSDRPILMPLVVVPFRAAFDPPPLQVGPMPRFKYVGVDWPDGSIFGADRIYRQFLAVAIALNALLMLSAALLFKRFGSGRIQVAGCLLILLNPYFISQTLFTWPKDLAAFFVLLAFYCLEFRKWPIAAGLLLGCGYLSHPLGLIYAASIGLYLVIRAVTKKISYLSVARFGTAFVVAVAPWFLWTKLALRVQDDLLQQNTHFEMGVETVLWVRIHNGYEFIGARMMELYPFNADAFAQLSIFCLPGVVGLLFTWYAYRELLEGPPDKPLIVIAGVIVPVMLILSIFGTPSAAATLNGGQVVSTLLILLALIHVAKRFTARTFWALVSVQLLFDGSLLCVRASHLDVFALMRHSREESTYAAVAGAEKLHATKGLSLIGWPAVIKSAKIPPNLKTPIAVGEEVKDSVWMNSTAIVVFDKVPLGDNPVFLTSVAIHPAVWPDMAGDGAVFRVEIVDGGKTSTVLEKAINPAHVTADRRWNDLAADLSQFKNKTVTIVFTTLPGPKGNEYADWCIWGAPRIVEK